MWGRAASMSRTPTVLRQGAHLKPIGSQTPEPRTNPGVRREASMESPLSLTSPLRKKPAALARLADKSATYGGEMDGMGSWEWMDESERQKMSMIQAKEHRKYIQHAQRELHRQREMVPLHAPWPARTRRASPSAHARTCTRRCSRTRTRTRARTRTRTRTRTPS